MTDFNKAVRYGFEILLISGFLCSCAASDSQYHKRSSGASGIQEQQSTGQPIRASQDRMDGVNKMDKMFERAAINGPYIPVSNYNSQNNQSSGNSNGKKQSVLSRFFEMLFSFFTRQ